MAAEIGLLSMTQIQNLSPQYSQHQNQPQPNPSHHHTTISTWMWNPKEQQGEEDDSWEVRAFAEDTRNIMDTTWPPRSYTCTFCRREFRSAQALGGHMNVHRRDRARLHHHQPHYPPSGSPIPTSPPFINIPPQELVANGGLCFLYHLPSPNAPPFPTHTLNACGESPSSLLSAVSSYPPNNFMVMPTSFDLDKAAGINGLSSYSSSSKVEEEPTSSSTNQAPREELDLELRLGHRSTPSS